LDTYLENRNFTEVSEEYRDDDWLFCRIRNGKFEGHGDPDKLYAILTVFKDWAEREKNADNTQHR
jgi:hypothetical protein